VLVGAAAGVYLFYRGFRILQRRRLILNTPTSKIRSASMGLVEVSGLAMGPHTLVAPITGAACFYYRTVAWQLKKSGKNERWEIVAEECMHLPFYLDDNTGRVLVDPQDAEMDIHRDFHEEFSGSLFSSSFEAPANVFAFLSRFGVSSDRKTRVDEYCLKPKNALFVLGTLATSSVAAAEPESNESPYPAKRVGMDRVNTRRSAPEVIRLSTGDTPVSSASMTSQGKIAAALMKAGITSPAAWAVAGVTEPTDPTRTSGTAVAATTALETFDPHPAVTLQKGTHEPTFLISWRSQKEIVKSLGWKSAAMIWGGPALTLLCVYILALHLHWM
jgi:E3 Ubiquitin ligase